MVLIIGLFIALINGLYLLTGILITYRLGIKPRFWLDKRLSGDFLQGSIYGLSNLLFRIVIQLFVSILLADFNADILIHSLAGIAPRQLGTIVFASISFTRSDCLWTGMLQIY